MEMSHVAGGGLFRGLLWAQGLFYLATGVWPLVSIDTFQAVTGPKTDHLVTGRESDHWLVMTVGALVAAVGLALLVAAWRGRNPIEMAVLAIGCAAGLTAIDVVYVSRQVIPPIYLADAAVEVVLILGWVVALARRR
jgi:NADH:ubiquinone oxidoreductase subunit K